jgi:tripeptidyl-peptidase I
MALPTFTKGDHEGACGTSASTPIVAGMVSRLNEARRRAGKGPLGFLNPLLYAHPGAFHDATEGSNAGCGTGGFSCGVGWDPVTGLGTPNVAKLEQIVLALPGAAVAEEPLPEMAPPSSAGVAEE